jgi:hypothetical protein
MADVRDVSALRHLNHMAAPQGEIRVASRRKKKKKVRVASPELSAPPLKECTSCVPRVVSPTVKGMHELVPPIVSPTVKGMHELVPRVVSPTVKGMHELRPRLLRVRIRVASRGQFAGIKVVGKIEHL